MTNQLKIYLKTFILIFGISILLLNCQKEEIIQLENQQTLSKSYKITSLENLFELQPVIQNIKKIKPIKQDKFTKDLSFLNSIENLNTEEIIHYTNETGYSTYNFKFNNSEDSINFENLHLLDVEGGGYIAYILSYEPEEEWYYDNLNTDGTLNFNISTYQGEITKFSLEREVIWSTKESAKSYAKSGGRFATLCTIAPPPPCDEGNHSDGQGWDGCIYSSGNYGETCQTVWVSGVGSNTGGNDGDNGGNGGGGSSNEECNDTSGTSIAPDYQPNEGITSDCTPNNNNGVSTTNTTDEIIIDPITFENYPCQADIVENIYNNKSELSNFITSAFGGTQNDVNLTYIMGTPKDPDTNLPVDAHMDPDYNSNANTLDAVITIDSTMAKNATDLYIATITIHENLHAVLAYAVLINNLTTSPNPDLYELAITYAKWRTQNDPNTNEHAFMATMVSEIAKSLKKYGESKGYFLLDSYYDDLSWSGEIGFNNDTFIGLPFEKKIAIRNALDNERNPDDSDSNPSGDKCK